MGKTGKMQALKATKARKLKALEAEYAQKFTEKEAEWNMQKYWTDLNKMSSKTVSESVAVPQVAENDSRRRLTGSEIAASAPHRRLVVLEKLLEDIKSANRNRDH